jgi:hypothetical protein
VELVPLKFVSLGYDIVTKDGSPVRFCLGLFRTPSVDALIPALYLKGISTGDFTEALAAILGEKASGLSATNIVS